MGDSPPCSWLQAPGSDELAISASGDVEGDQLSGRPSKQSRTGER